MNRFGKGDIVRFEPSSGKGGTGLWTVTDGGAGRISLHNSAGEKTEAPSNVLELVVQHKQSYIKIPASFAPAPPASPAPPAVSGYAFEVGDLVQWRDQSTATIWTVVDMLPAVGWYNIRVADRVQRAHQDDLRSAVPVAVPSVGAQNVPGTDLHVGDFVVWASDAPDRLEGTWRVLGWKLKGADMFVGLDSVSGSPVLQRLVRAAHLVRVPAALHPLDVAVDALETEMRWQVEQMARGLGSKHSYTLDRLAVVQGILKAVRDA